MQRLLICMLLPILVLGCEAVPEVDFPVDATADVRDTGVVDSDAAQSDDAPASCPTTPPFGATTCCGPVPCIGDCLATSQVCLDCQQCSPGQFCCAKTTGHVTVSCLQLGSRCP